MCRATSLRCSELGDDSTLWNAHSPLPPPDWFASQLDVFVDCVKSLAGGDLTLAMSKLRAIRSDEMRAWVINHGMASGVHRKRRTNKTVVSIPKESRHAIRSPARLEREVFERDSYSCRYCGLRLIDKRVLEAVERRVPSEFAATLRPGRVRDVDLHGVVHAFKIVADHVEPHRTGGLTTLDNLVSACPTCNYGKSWYTIDELGIEDPRARAPARREWDGLRSFLAQLE